MGSTLVMAVFENTTAHIAHVGDSRAYLINDEGLRRLTTDHSLVERLIATNQITREEALSHPQRNVIYRTMGDKADVQADYNSHTLAPHDRILLCSDGLSGVVDDELICKIVTESKSPQEACDQLIRAANAAGGDDNITAVILQVLPV